MGSGIGAVSAATLACQAYGKHLSCRIFPLTRALKFPKGCSQRVSSYEYSLLSARKLYATVSETIAVGRRLCLEQHEGVRVLLLDVLQGGPQQLSLRGEQVHAAAQGALHEVPLPCPRQRKHHLRICWRFEFAGWGPPAYGSSISCMAIRPGGKTRLAGVSVQQTTHPVRDSRLTVSEVAAAGGKLRLRHRVIKYFLLFALLIVPAAGPGAGCSCSLDLPGAVRGEGDRHDWVLVYLWHPAWRP